VCLFVGRFVEKKGMRLLEKLVPLTPDMVWLFAGHGPLRPPQPAGQQVHIFEDLDHAGLAELYRAADLLVLPSQGEGFPLVVQEAFACGLPAIVSDATADGCEEARGLLEALPVTGENAAALWQARLSALLGEHGALDSRRAAVAGFAAQRWGWDGVVARYETWYEAMSRR
jgi:glycosyltransferase involved in cell wall biosynthesis